MRIPLYQVDAFTSTPFSGNPAVVCLLNEPRDDRWLQYVAREMNVPATAFLRWQKGGFDLRWIEGLLVGAVVASTDAAAVFFLMHARGLRVRPRVSATLEVESGSNDPFAVLLTMLLVEFLRRDG